ncbi:Oidioi.mRNA.OKI2018_I69.chr2.g7096.t1.cds [Oikopleura dioica]|uniref:Oidioi.mRNA.OKI2018_I69.chr2.g7096.t1.cds n=1 Tax=Oikopleura dioica TaxID=34765 RepID=A0ABN7TBM9_OIKDI|nr:Oidioi.mRNA.OKI2018_I69.chr2.g7096.t1.cds [Oikopleura dioica]
MTPMLMFLNVSTRAPLASASVFVGAFVVNLFVGISTVIVGVLSRDDKTRTDSYIEAELAIKRRGSQTSFALLGETTIRREESFQVLGALN